MALGPTKGFMEGYNPGKYNPSGTDIPVKKSGVTSKVSSAMSAKSPKKKSRLGGIFGKAASALIGR